MIFLRALAVDLALDRLWPWVVGTLLACMLLMTPLMAMFMQPWAPWWFGGAQAIPIGTPFDFNSLSPVAAAGDAARYQLARAAGFNEQEAITAVAVSLAECEKCNIGEVNATGDVGLWQINKVHWPDWGGLEAVIDPFTNAKAAYKVYKEGGWCKWFTYATSCGQLHHGTYLQFMERARLAASGNGPEGPLLSDNSALMDAIRPWMGIEYLFGGMTKDGVDCSAFVQAVYAQLGIRLPRTAQPQYNATLRVNDPRVGDLVFFQNTYPSSDRITHVGIVVGDGIMISAATPRVARQSWNDPFWRAHFAGFGRIQVQGGNQA